MLTIVYRRRQARLTSLIYLSLNPCKYFALYFSLCPFPPSFCFRPLSHPVSVHYLLFTSIISCFRPLSPVSVHYLLLFLSSLSPILCFRSFSSGFFRLPLSMGHPPCPSKSFDKTYTSTFSLFLIIALSLCVYVSVSLSHTHSLSHSHTHSHNISSQCSQSILSSFTLLRLSRLCLRVESISISRDVSPRQTCSEST